jgi:hypothetical protein
MEQEVFIGRNCALPGTTAQNAFWDYITDPQNPILYQLNTQWLGARLDTFSPQ